MTFDGEYFQQIFGIIMGTYVAPVLANIYRARLEIILKEKCKSDFKLKWPILFKKFFDDGFGITKGNKFHVEARYNYLPNLIIFMSSLPLINSNLGS